MANGISQQPSGSRNTDLGFRLPLPEKEGKEGKEGRQAPSFLSFLFFPS